MNKTLKLLLLTYVISVVTLMTLTIVYHEGHRNTLTHRVVTIASATIFMTLIFAVVLLFINNQRLRAANKKLYEKALLDLEYSQKAKDVKVMEIV